MMAGNITHLLLKTINEYSDYFLLIDDFFITGVIAEKAGINRFGTSLIRRSSCSDSDICLLHNNTPIDFCQSSKISDVWSKYKAFSVEYCLFLASSTTNPDHARGCLGSEEDCFNKTLSVLIWIMYILIVLLLIVFIIFIAYDIYQWFE